jgi:RNA polymerase sigma-70 factor (ECF subfamily)
MQVLSLKTCFLKDISLVRSDGEVVNAVLGGDRKAFAILVKRYERSVRAIGMCVLRDRHLAQDAAQDAFVKAYQKLGSLRKAHSFGSWLMKISHRCALDIVPQRRERALPEGDFVEAGPVGLLDDEKERLLAAVMRLRESERQVVMLRYFDGYSVKEVAGIAGRSVGTVTKQLSRAHRHLKVLLKGGLSHER